MQIDRFFFAPFLQFFPVRVTKSAFFRLRFSEKFFKNSSETVFIEAKNDGVSLFLLVGDGLITIVISICYH